MTAFVDSEVTEELEKLNSGNIEKDKFPEFSFIATCLKVGLTTSDLKELTYVEVEKILLSFIDTKSSKQGPRKATQADIDMLLG